MSVQLVSGVFDTATWPVLVVNGAAVIQRANGAAQAFFGEKLAAAATQLAAFWTSENELSPGAFIARVREMKGFSTLVRLRGKGVAVTPFTACGSVDSEDVLVQLLPGSNPARGADGKQASVEVNLAQKQKLDCALQLTRTVALDFNNTLTAILGHVTHLLSHAPSDHPWRSSLVEIEKAADRASEVANQLGAFTSETKDAMAQTTGNINALLRRTIELFQTPQNSGIAWNIELESRVFTVNYDEAKMQQAFVKVIENAVQAIPPNGRIGIQTRNLELTSATQDRTAHLAPGTYVCLEISDAGCGIEPAALPRVFEPFFTTKYGHRGLGLAWVYGIVTNHGGGVAISSQLHQGTTVRVYLPAVRKVVEERIITDDQLHGKETILIVDDEDMVLTMAELVLKSHGYRVLTANSGEKGIEVLNNTKSLIDLLITDMVMPKMNGRELIEKVRVLSPATHIVCATACTRSVQMESKLDFLTKPFTAQALLRKVKEALTPEPA